MKVTEKHLASDIDLKTEIESLAAFLNIHINHAGDLNLAERLQLLQQLVAVSQMKLTRLALCL